MNKTVVIYASRYGSTRRYAQWIAEDLHCPLFAEKDFDPRTFVDYEVIIYGGGLYAGGVNGIKLLSKNRKLLSGKKVMLFTCGLADPKDPYNVSHIRNTLQKSLTPELWEQIRIFHLRGGIDYSRLSVVHRSMMAMLRRMLLKKDADCLREEDKQLLATYGKCVDFTDRNSILPLIRCAMSGGESCSEDHPKSVHVF